MPAGLCTFMHLSRQAVIALSRLIYQAQARPCQSGKLMCEVAFAVQDRVLGCSSLTHHFGMSRR